MLALGEALVARGHAVALQTWRRWEEHAAGGRDDVRRRARVPGLPDARAAAQARTRRRSRRRARRSRRCEAFAPDIAVSDVLTPAPALAAELCGVPVATLVPHVHPWSAPGFPPYALGARLPRTALGRVALAPLRPARRRGPRAGPREYNDCRARLGLAPLPGCHTGLSRALTLVATLPQLEYPRGWEPWLRVVGPLLWEPPAASASRRRRATARSCSSRRRPRRTPSTRCCAPRSPGSPARRCA